MGVTPASLMSIVWALGLLPRSESLLGALKLVAIWALVQLAGATAAQLVGRAVRRKGTAA